MRSDDLEERVSREQPRFGNASWSWSSSALGSPATGVGRRPCRWRRCRRCGCGHCGAGGDGWLLAPAESLTHPRSALPRARVAPVGAAAGGGGTSVLLAPIGTEESLDAHDLFSDAQLILAAEAEHALPELGLITNRGSTGGVAAPCDRFPRRPLGSRLCCRPRGTRQGAVGRARNGPKVAADLPRPRRSRV